ncbi:hypothetical protein CDD83_6390 [Cordyceps sp. RAO-2017]|nr:hypothetical protein CDD83_6390 [Cordyceps sp. RAO-2017]
MDLRGCGAGADRSASPPSGAAAAAASAERPLGLRTGWPSRVTGASVSRGGRQGCCAGGVVIVNSMGAQAGWSASTGERLAARGRGAHGTGFVLLGLGKRDRPACGCCCCGDEEDGILAPRAGDD